MADARELAQRGLHELNELMSAATATLAAAERAADASQLEFPPAIGVPAQDPQGIIDAQRVRYDAARAALEEVLQRCSQLSPSQHQVEVASSSTSNDTAAEAAERATLEARVHELRQEALRKNVVIKGLITEMRELLADVNMWKAADEAEGDAAAASAEG